MKKVTFALCAAVCVSSCMTEEMTISQFYEMVSHTDEEYVFMLMDWDEAGPYVRFMDNVPVFRSDEAYSGNGYMAGKGSGMASYFAYCPYDPDYEWNDGIRFTVSRDISTQNDLLYACAPDRGHDSQTVSLVFRHALSRICVMARSLPNEYGHTVRVRAVRLGSGQDGGHFYTDAVFDLLGNGVWKDAAADNENPLTFTLDESRFNTAASSLPADYTALTDEDSYIMVIPQDFSGTGLPVEVDFSIMDGSEIMMDDTLKCLIYTELAQGETCSVKLDLTLVPISFVPTVDPWISDTIPSSADVRSE